MRGRRERPTLVVIGCPRRKYINSMGDFVVGTIQQQVKIYDTPLAYQADIFRFLELAHDKQASLVILPALSPLMLIPPLASLTKLDQLKKGQERKGRLSDFVGKLFDKQASAPQTEPGGVKEALIALLDDYPGEIYEAYIDLFSAAALKYQTTIVAGSFYLREHESAPGAHVSYVFGPDGMVLGRQEKIHPTDEEKSFCRAGTVLQMIETPVGRTGILIQEDALYPECGRILAYNGVEILINLTASPGQTRYHQIRNAFLARVDENGLLGIQSCLVGHDLFDPDGQNLFGRAALAQPFQLSPKGDGVMSEAGNANEEEFIVASISLEALKDHWVQAKPRMRQEMHMAAYQPLIDIYRHGRTLDQVYWNPEEPEAGREDGKREGEISSSSRPSQVDQTELDSHSEANISNAPLTQDDD